MLEYVGFNVFELYVWHRVHVSIDEYILCVSVCVSVCVCKYVCDEAGSLFCNVYRIQLARDCGRLLLVVLIHTPGGQGGGGGSSEPHTPSLSYCFPSLSTQLFIYFPFIMATRYPGPINETFLNVSEAVHFPPLCGRREYELEASHKGVANIFVFINLKK